MENNNNNNGRGIFYGVIGVATLVVAIIGATFAYFSATTNSNVDAVSTTSATVDLNYYDDITSGLKTNLIPVFAFTDSTDTTSTEYKTANAFKTVVGTGSTKCVDLNGNNICSVYQFTIENPSTTAKQEIFVSLTPKTNKFTNLHYAIFKGTFDTVGGSTATLSGSLDVNGTVPTTKPTADCDNTICDWGDLADGTLVAKGQFTLDSTTAITLGNLQQVLNTLEKVSYSVVVWVQDTGLDQTQADSGKSFEAQINVTTANGDSGVTGKLIAG